MRLESVEGLQPGLIVARPLYDEMGQVLLHQGVQLLPQYIQMLRDKGLTHIYVSDPEMDLGIEAEEDISPELRAKALTAIRTAYDAVQGELTQILRNTKHRDLKKICASQAMRALLDPRGPIGRLREVASQILDDVLTRATLAGLTSIKCANSQLYEHSLDVCVVSIMIGRAIGMTNMRLNQLATGCLLHDIGKVFVESDEDEERMIRQHTLLGFELLRQSPDPDIMAPHVALEHHERQDGRGLPRGLIGSNEVARRRDTDKPVPTLIGEVAAVANLYDNLMSGAGQVAHVTPDEAVSTIMKGAGTVLNRAVVNSFLRVVPVYPKGMEVTVRTDPYKNFGAIVAKVNQSKLDRPVIIIYQTAKGHRIEPLTVDLAEDPDLHIRTRKV